MTSPARIAEEARAFFFAVYAWPCRCPVELRAEHGHRLECATCGREVVRRKEIDHVR